MSRNRCKPGRCVDERMRGGRRKCTVCGDVFPCSRSCEHLDCIVARGEELPDYVGPEARDAIGAELLACGLVDKVPPAPKPNLSPDDFGA